MLLRKSQLPPLAEQRRIAEVLDRAEALRAKRRAALAQLDSLTQSLFLDLFGDPATNPKGWAHKTLLDLGKVVTGGSATECEAWNVWRTNSVLSHRVSWKAMSR